MEDGNGGSRFPFPFKPYAIQERFMEALYAVLDEGKVGIFESPTGTVSPSSLHLSVRVSLQGADCWLVISRGSLWVWSVEHWHGWKISKRRNVKKQRSSWRTQRARGQVIHESILFLFFRPNRFPGVVLLYRTVQQWVSKFVLADLFSFMKCSVLETRH